MRQLVDRIATIYLRYLLPVIAFTLPLFFLPITVDFFIFNKRLLLFVLASLAVVAWALRNLTRKRLSITYSPTLLPILGFAIIAIISSSIQAPNYIYSLLGQTSNLVALTLIFLTVTSSQKNDFVIRSTIMALLSSAAVLSFLSLLQTTGVIDQLSSVSWLKGRFFTPAGGPLPFLSFTLPLIPAAIYLGFKSDKFNQKITTFILTAIVIAGSITQLGLIFPQTDQNRLALLPISAGWSIAVDIFKNLKTSLLGTGPETFISAFTRLRPTELNLTSYWDTRFYVSTNEIFTILTTTGLISLILLLLGLTKSMISSLSVKPNPHHRFAQILTLSTLITFFIIPGNLVIYTLLFVAITLLTLSLKLNNHKSIRDLGLNLYDELQAEPKTGSYLLPLPLAILIVFGLLSFWKFYIPTYQASIATYKAISTLTSNPQESYQQQIKAYQLDPSNPTYRINFSQTSLALATSLASQKDLSDQDKNNLGQLIQQSIREAKNATSLEPTNVTTWENLASVYRQLIGFAQGAPDWTVASYAQSILLDPSNPRLRFELGGIYYALKDYDTAIKLFEQAIERKPDWANAHYNLAAAYKDKKDYAKALTSMRSVLSLVQNNASDAEKASIEIQALEKLSTPQTTPTPTPTPKASDIKLVTPTPFPKTSTTPVPLPSDVAPELPVSPTPTPSS